LISEKKIEIYFDGGGPFKKENDEYVYEPVIFDKELDSYVMVGEEEDEG